MDLLQFLDLDFLDFDFDFDFLYFLEGLQKELVDAMLVFEFEDLRRWFNEIWSLL